MSINVGDKIKSSFYREGEIYTVTRIVSGMQALFATCDSTPEDDYPWHFTESNYQKVYQMPKGATRMPMFTETVTETKIKKVVDWRIGDSVLVSVVPQDNGTVRIVVGARYDEDLGNLFSKECLTELIEELKLVRDCM